MVDLSSEREEAGEAGRREASITAVILLHNTVRTYIPDWSTQ